MSLLTVTENWADGSTLTAAQLSTAMTSIESVVNGNIDSTNIATGGVSTTNLASEAVTEAKLGPSAVTTAKVADGAVTGVKLNSNVVDNSTLAISSNQLIVKDGGITSAKMAALGQQVSSSSGSFSMSSSTFADVTNLTVSITTTGRPVVLHLIGDGAGSYSNILIVNSSTSGSNGLFNSGAIKFLRDASEVDCQSFGPEGVGLTAPNLILPPGSFFTYDAPAAGTYTYKVQVAALNSDTLQVNNVRLFAYQL